MNCTPDFCVTSGRPLAMIATTRPPVIGVDDPAAPAEQAGAADDRRADRVQQGRAPPVVGETLVSTRGEQDARRSPASTRG